MGKIEPNNPPILPKTSLIHDLLHNSDVVPCYMHGDGVRQPWIMPIYGQSVELEVLDLLYCFVRYLRPAVVVELGCHLGFGAYALGRACLDINHGHVVTCDISDEYCDKTRTRVRGLPVSIYHGSADSVHMKVYTRQAELLWVDCDYEGRAAMLDQMKVGAVAIIHDTRQSPELIEMMKPTLETATFQYVHFGQTHRGLSIVQRVK